MEYVNIINVDYESAWRNWQTHMTQNHAGNREGSIPSAGTIYQNEKIPILYGLVFFYSYLFLLFHSKELFTIVPLLYFILILHKNYFTYHNFKLYYY